MDIQEQFREWFKSQMPESYKNWDNKLSEIKNAYFTSFKSNVFDVDLDNKKLSIDNILSNLRNRYHVPDKTFADYNKKSSNGIPQAILKTWLIPFLGNYKSGITINNTKIIKTNKNPKKYSNHYTEENSLSDKPNEIIDRTMDIIKDINQECKECGKSQIFKVSEHNDYLIDIKHSCESLSIYKDLTNYIYKIIFKDFILNLYIIIYETTRVEKSNATTKGKPFYDYKLPDEFLRNGTETKRFMEIVGTLRHHYAHLKPEYKEVQIKKISSYENVLGELLKPESREDFQKLQNKVLKLFEVSMEKLLEIVKKK